ncbi:uncharacterized protein LOC133415763 [Phycodurus eques]|uniref:uncharacterized protein LOC133415763 n=1 Tax=Phycodurus eques TaxID=693459 RepID=UPI002ACD3C52|nr:uncharacterized protein LOC133415763 [Phycodurus eques]
METYISESLAADYGPHVHQVLQRLLENKLFVKAEKCAFHVPKTTFLGYVIAEGQLQMDPAKVAAVTEWPTPSTRKERQRFLGFTNFYRRFIRNYSGVAAPLTALTSTLTSFQWSEKADMAFCERNKRFFLSSYPRSSGSTEAVHS